MTLQQIRYVAEIARHGTISKAAQELYITQPHLSSVLKELENELGITIFSRARKGVVLTEDGREFLHFARPLLEQEERILNFYADKPSAAAPSPPSGIPSSSRPFTAISRSWPRNSLRSTCGRAAWTP